MKLIVELSLFADEEGRIWRPTQDGLIEVATRIRQDGYVVFNHRGQTLYVHRVVCAAFHGRPPSPEHEADHDNGVRNDNRPANLSWMTKAENLIRRRNRRPRPPPTEPRHPYLLELWRQRQ